MTNPPGWYPYPNDPKVMRYWDGNRWTEAEQPTPQSQVFVAAARPLASIGGLATATQVGFGIFVAVTALSIYAGLNRISVVSDMIDDVDSVTFEKADQADKLVQVTALLQIALVLVIGILWLVWFRRCYDNITATRRRLVHSGGWAVGSWLVPFLNFVRPKQIADDMFRATSPTASVPGYVHLWWGLFIASGLLGRGVRAGDDSLSGIRTSDRIGTVADVVTLMAAIAAVAVLRALTKATSAAMQPPAPVIDDSYRS